MDDPVSPDNSVINVKNLTVRFVEREVISDFSFSVNKGQTVLLKGPSGCGKSTMLQVLLGFVPAASGTVNVLSHDFANSAELWQARKKMAYVPQEPDLGEGTAEEWLRQAFEYAANRHLSYNKTAVDSLLARLALSPERLASRTVNLSGGEKQRIALIGALLLERPLILLDEPTSALDAESRKLVYQILIELHGKTIVAVSHDDDATEFLPARIVDLTRHVPAGAAR